MSVKKALTYLRISSWTKVYLAANGKGKDVQRFVKWSKRQKTDRWITYFSNQMGFPMRDVPYGDDSAWQPDKLCFNPIYTHTHTCRASTLAQSSPNTCYTEREPSIMAVTRQRRKSRIWSQHLNQSGASIHAIDLIHRKPILVILEVFILSSTFKQMFCTNTNK